MMGVVFYVLKDYTVRCNVIYWRYNYVYLLILRNKDYLGVHTDCYLCFKGQETFPTAHIDASNIGETHVHSVADSINNYMYSNKPFVLFFKHVFLGVLISDSFFSAADDKKNKIDPTRARDNER